MKTLTSVILKNSKRQELTSGSKILTVLAFLIVSGFLAIIMIVFSVIATKRLGEIGQSYAFVNMLLLMNFIIVFSESIFHALNTLYFSKDLNTFLRLPIKSKDLVHAKMVDMIISQYEMEALMLAIPAITYGVITQVSGLFYLYLLIILLVLPIIPISITTLIVAIIMRFTNFIKNKSKVMYITIILAVLLLGVVLGNFTGGETEEFSVSTFERVILQANGLSREISERFVLIKPIMNTLLNYNNVIGLQNILVYVVETIVVFIAIRYIISTIYLKGAIGTIVNGQKDRKVMEKLTIKDFKKKLASKTYILKELKVMFRTPIFFIQCILMPLIYPAVTMAAVIGILNFAQKININIMETLMVNIRSSVGYATFLAIGQGFYMLNFSSIISVSKEGRSAILLKSFPIDLAKQFKYKTLIGVIVNIFPAIIITIAYYLCIKNIYLAVTLFLGLLLLNIFGEKCKLLVDLKNPQIKWETEYTMMKQNTNVMYELFYTIIVIMIMGLLGLVAGTTLYASILILVVLIFANVMINKHITKKKSQIFAKLY